MKIDDANELSAFATNRNGFDVVRLERYVPSQIANEEHRKNLLTDAQWQTVINAIDEALKKLEL